jgi:hypothetical protein
MAIANYETVTEIVWDWRLDPAGSPVYGWTLVEFGDEHSRRLGGFVAATRAIAVKELPNDSEIVAVALALGEQIGRRVRVLSEPGVWRGTVELEPR